MGTEFTKQYTDLLIIQYHNKPKAKGHLEVFASELEKIYNLMVSFEDAFDLDKATGKQLDIIGKIVGISRRIPNIALREYFGFDGYFNTRTFNEAPFFNINESPYTDYQMNDTDYRFYINAKVLKNFVNAKMSKGYLNIQRCIDNLFSNKAIISDNRNMTFDLWIKESFNIDKIRYINVLDLYPLPAGTKIRDVWIYPDDGDFLDYDNATKYEE
jgi:hypothetical protein